MRPLLFAVFLLCLSRALALAAKDAPGGVLSAIDQLPRGEWKRIARIEARDGAPAPERWHIITHDPKDENGLHEYVVAGSELVASRKLSQFVESVRAEDVFTTAAIKIDFDRLAALAQEYASANNTTIAALNYALKKEGAEAVPLWSVSCLDATGREIAKLVISATKGTVISHEGFTAAPRADALERLETQSESELSREERRRRERRPIAAATPIPVATPLPADKKDIFSRMGNSVNKFFTGKGRP